MDVGKHSGLQLEPQRPRLGKAGGARLAFAFLCALHGAAASAAQVAIDVGHNRQEPGGTSARGRAEFEFNRDLARDIAAALERRGLTLRLLGEDGNADSEPTRRVDGLDASFLLSVHHDSVDEFLLVRWEFEGRTLRYSDRFSGFSLFVSRDNPRADQSLRCASRIGASLRAAGFTPSRYHAHEYSGKNRPFADEANGVHYFDKLKIVLHAKMPAVLLETGVIVNRDEELRMRDPAVREKIAGAVAEGIAGCLAGEP